MAVETPVVVNLLYDFQCNECDFATDSHDYFKTHKKIKHENEGIIYRCDICTKTFNYPSAVKVHKENLHSDSILYYCKYCNHISNCKQNIAKHEKRCLLSKQREQCQKCGKFLKLSHMTTHKKVGCVVKVGKDPSTLTLQCEKCDYKTHQDIYLRRHKVNYHSNNVIHCEFCKFRSPYQVKLRIHTIKYHPLLKCESCDFQTNIRDKMRQHHRNIHPLLCKHCQFSTVFEYTLKLHACEVHREKIDCDFKEKEKCDYRITSMEDWKNHRISQHNLDFYSCKKCNFVTGNRIDLSSHHSYYHKKHECFICKLSFTTKDDVKKHEQSEHKNFLFLCQYCQYYCTQSITLKVHKHRKHFVCSKCEIVCKNKPELNEHMKSAHGSNMHKCRHCDFSYDTVKQYSIHRKTHSDVHKKERKRGKRFPKIVCKDCSFTCHSIKEYRLHRIENQLSHGKENEKRKTKSNVYCKFCDFVSTTKKEYFLHRKESHPNVHKCRICNFIPKSSKEYVSHKGIHKKKAKTKTLKDANPMEDYDENDIEILVDELPSNTEMQTPAEYMETEDDKMSIELDLSAIIASLPADSYIEPVKEEEVSTKEDDSEGTTYVCPINACTYMAKNLSQTLQNEHYRSKHPDADTVNIQFLIL